MTGAIGPSAPVRLDGRWYILAAAVLWGTTGTAQALAPPSATSLTIGAIRIALGGLVLVALAVLRGELRVAGGHPEPAEGGWPPLPVLIGGAAVAAYQLCFFAGVGRAGVAVGTIVAIGSAPVVAGLLGLLVRGERPSLRWVLATVLAVAGCGLLVWGDTASVDPLGVLLALGAGVAYAVYAVASKQLLDRRPPLAVMAVVFCLGGLLLAPLLIGADLAWLASSRGLVIALHLGLIATALSYALFARGLAVVPVATAATLSLAEPLTAGLLGVLLLGERLSPFALAGIGLLLVGLAVLASEGRGARD